MKIVKTKRGMFPLRFPYSMENDTTFMYFINGEGYKKTKSFQVIDADLPDFWDELSWLHIVRIYDEYGEYVAHSYANNKTAGIVSLQTLRGFYALYKKAQSVIDDSFSPIFFDMCKCDYMLSCFGVFCLDIIKLDERLSSFDGDYDCVNCTYKGVKTSMSEYIENIYGEKYKKAIDLMLT